MSLGRCPAQSDAFRCTRTFCEPRLSEVSIYRLLHDKAHELFPDDAFADLFAKRGRKSIPPQIVAVVMVLQRLEGLSDREAIDRFTFDLRWKYAAGDLDVEHPDFVHTVLVDMRARLRQSERPNRIFDAVVDLATSAGLVGHKRVLDSTPLYDAVATQDTVTLIRSAIRGLLKVCGTSLKAELRAVLKRDDTYSTPGKPACDWNDQEAREALIDALARDGHAALAVLHERVLALKVQQAGELLATVLGQDLEQTKEGVFRIAQKVARDRVISTIDPEARHGHKTTSRGFDGYKGHVSVDPDSEIITSTTVTAGNVADGAVAEELLAESLTSEDTRIEGYGDASYGTGEILDKIDPRIDPYFKVPAPSARKGHFSKEQFDVDLDAMTVRCPHGELVQIRRRTEGRYSADFGARCKECPLREQCTSSKSGRKICVTKHEPHLQRERERQKSPEWQEKYKATRPKVERKLAHMMRRRHGGRRARMRGAHRVGQDFALLAAATNLHRIAQLQTAE